MFRNLLIAAAKGDENDEMSEVYAYANTFGITPMQVEEAVANKPLIRERLIAWKYLLHSLVNTECTPWLATEGVAYIDTNIIPTVNTIVEVKSYQTQQFSFIIGSRYNAFGFGRIQKNSMQFFCGTSPTVSNLPNMYAVHTIRFLINNVTNKGELYIDGAKYGEENNTFASSNQPLFLYEMNSNGSARGWCYNNTRISYAEIMDGQSRVGYFVPYCDNGTYGMLDLVTGTFYGSAVQNGLFTYILEDANGNAVNIT